eukprot:CAMPEP_0194422304 /NCGR_PEP_ID=MMETSP0176-20130528/21572_1 /TAXON_ID=216777 /ORGANISM="Proboscia alata, Strain PI-D3" /LENGTH=37 /DNA_ID= /DNA_START= /DNA_END= /DNA_ORIENTATION=
MEQRRRGTGAAEKDSTTGSSPPVSNSDSDSNSKSFTT